MARDAAKPVSLPAGAPPMDADLAELAKTSCTWCGSTARDTYQGERCHWHRCQQCGFWISELIVDPHVYAAEDYGLDYQHSYYGSSLRRKLRTAHYRFQVMERVYPAKGHFIDIGCSYGSMLLAGNERGWQTHGVDIAPIMVERGREQGLDIQLGSLTEIPYEDGSLDVVHARHVLEHDVQTYRALLEIQRVMKPGGLLVVEVPDGACRRTRLDPAKEVPEWSYLHMVTFTPSVLRGFMDRVGFELLPEPWPVPGQPSFQAWHGWKRFREARRWATYFVTFWRKP